MQTPSTPSATSGSAWKAKLAVIGISDYAQHTLSDIVYVELPDVGDTAEPRARASAGRVRQGRRGDLAPVSGEVVEVNASLEANPEWLNDDPLRQSLVGQGDAYTTGRAGDLMDAKSYETYMAEEEEKGAH